MRFHHPLSLLSLPGWDERRARITAISAHRAGAAVADVIDRINSWCAQLHVQPGHCSLLSWSIKMIHEFGDSQPLSQLQYGRT